MNDNISSIPVEEKKTLHIFYYLLECWSVVITICEEKFSYYIATGLRFSGKSAASDKQFRHMSRVQTML